MTCEYLLLNGANLNCADAKGYTPLHLSIEIGNTALAYLLLKHKAKYDMTTNDGNKRRRKLKINIDFLQLNLSGKLPIDFAVATAVS